MRNFNKQPNTGIYKKKNIQEDIEHCFIQDSVVHQSINIPFYLFLSSM